MRRATWICGDQRVLVEEIVDTIRTVLAPATVDYVSMYAGASGEAQVWAEANQYPLNPGSNRMILIRDAEKLTHWDRLAGWMSRTRQLPGVYLVFVSNETDLPYVDGSRKAGLKPHAAMLKAPRGSLVRCTLPGEADAVAWVQRRNPRMSAALGKYLLVRTGGNLAEAAAVCAKLNLFDGLAAEATIDALTRQRPTESFVDTVLNLDKPMAMLAAQSVAESDAGRVVGLLDSRLDLLAALHRIQISGQALREVTTINPYLARQYIGIARHYDAARCSYRRRVLAVMDDALRCGARDGVWEALVALW